MPACRAVDMSFIEQAPLTIVNVVDLEAPPDRVFEILADVDSWPEWFAGATKVEWTSPAPHGVGSTRRVYIMGRVRVDETFLVWEPGKRFAFRLDDQNFPLARAAIEDVQLEDLGNGRCRMQYSVHMELPGPLGLLGPALKPVLRAVFGRGARGMGDYVKKA